MSIRHTTSIMETVGLLCLRGFVVPLGVAVDYFLDYHSLFGQDFLDLIHTVPDCSEEVRIVLMFQSGTVGGHSLFDEPGQSDELVIDFVGLDEIRLDFGVMLLQPLPGFISRPE